MTEIDSVEIDRLVAINVVGWEYYPDTGRWGKKGRPPEANTISDAAFWGTLPAYSRDIRNALDLVKIMHEKGYKRFYLTYGYSYFPNNYCAEFGNKEAWSRFPAMAICLAALSAVGADVDKVIEDLYWEARRGEK